MFTSSLWTFNGVSQYIIDIHFENINNKHGIKQSDSLTVMTVSLSVPGSGLSSGVVAGIVVGVVLVVAAAVGVMINRRRSSRNGMYHLQIL